MNKLILLLSATLIASFSAMANENVIITIDVVGAKYNKGQIMCAIFDSKKSFLKEPAASQTVQIDKNNKAQCVFSNMPKGEYAATAVYDLDNNNKMKTNFLGLPKEPVGMSNNHRPRFGPPKFKKAKEQVNTNHTFNIEVEGA